MSCGEPAGSGLPGLTRRGFRGFITVRRTRYSNDSSVSVVSLVERVGFDITSVAMLVQY